MSYGGVCFFRLGAGMGADLNSTEHLQEHPLQEEDMVDMAHHPQLDRRPQAEDMRTVEGLPPQQDPRGLLPAPILSA